MPNSLSAVTSLGQKAVILNVIKINDFFEVGLFILKKSLAVVFSYTINCDAHFPLVVKLAWVHEHLKRQ